MAYKDAEEKSNAASEALLSALVLSDKKGTHRGGGGARQGQGKSKTKKKKKDHRKTQELKLLYTGYFSVPSLWQLTVVQIYIYINSPKKNGEGAGTRSGKHVKY